MQLIADPPCEIYSSFTWSGIVVEKFQHFKNVTNKKKEEAKSEPCFFPMTLVQGKPTTKFLFTVQEL